MTQKLTLFIAIPFLVVCCSNHSGQGETGEQTARFNISKDLLLVQYDCKTDVDDLHSVAAFRTLIADPRFANLKYHAVAGTYGIQEGLYVPPEALFVQAFGDNWTDAHADFTAAIANVKVLVESALDEGGDVWIADAGQSDFTATLIKTIQSNLPQLNTVNHIHVVQHSNWNEEVTSPDELEYVKQNSDYHKIPDGNVVGNGTPGFRSSDYKTEQIQITDPELKQIWQTANHLCSQYNGQGGRYLNEAIAAGGFDFSDLSEVAWILELENIHDVEAFFNTIAQ